MSTTFLISQNHDLSAMIVARSRPGLDMIAALGMPSEVRSIMWYVSLESVPVPLPLHAVEQNSASSEGNERFKKVISDLHFSKTFILTYPITLIALLLVFTTIHWGSRLHAWRKKTRNLAADTAYTRSQNVIEDAVPEGKGGYVFENRSSGNSSTGSTLGGDGSSEDSNEQTSLILKPRLNRSGTTRSHMITTVKAWLVYQPQPIPFINKTLPSNGESFVVIAFIGLQIFYTFFKTPMSLSMLFVFADRTSLLFVANLPLLYLFAAKNQPLKLLTGRSYETLNIFHRRLGEVMCLLALLHSAGMVGVWYTILRPEGVSLVKFLLIKMILLGLGAFFAYELIYFTSLGSFRQRCYELFLGLHVVLQATALILVWFHHHGSRPYVAIALGIFLVDRLVYRMSVKSVRLSALLEVMKDRRTIRLRATIPVGNHRSFLSYMCGASNIASGWKATDHLFLTVPSLAPKHTIQAHPFTIASGPPSSTVDEAKLELLIRAQDGFSAELLQYASDHSAASIRLDGPYGSQSAAHLLQTSDHAITVAGGSGIAVTWPLIWSLLDAYNSDDLEGSVGAVNRRKILFVWVIREPSHLSWLDQGKVRELTARGVTVEIPPPTGAYGHPNIHGLIENWATPLKGQIGVVASGPDGLNRSVRNTCASLLRQGRKVHVEIEKFGW